MFGTSNALPGCVFGFGGSLSNPTVPYLFEFFYGLFGLIAKKGEKGERKERERKKLMLLFASTINIILADF